MKKTLLILFVLMVLFVSVVPVSAASVKKPFLNYVNPTTRTIEVCWVIPMNIWCLPYYVAEDAVIIIPENPGKGELEDLKINYYISFTVKAGVVTKITQTTQKIEFA